MGWSHRPPAPGRRRCSTRATGRASGRRRRTRSRPCWTPTCRRRCPTARSALFRGRPTSSCRRNSAAGRCRRATRRCMQATTSIRPGWRSPAADVPVGTRLGHPDHSADVYLDRHVDVDGLGVRVGTPRLLRHRPDDHGGLPGRRRKQRPRDIRDLRPPRPGRRHGRRRLRRGRCDHDHVPGGEGRHGHRDGHLQRNPARRHRDVHGRRQVGGHERRRRQGHREASGPTARRLGISAGSSRASRPS